MTRWLIGLGLVLLPLTPAWAEGLDLEQVQRNIDAQGLQWTAGETDWSSLSRAELRQRLIPMERMRELAAEWDAEVAENPAPPPLTDPEDLPRRFTWGDYYGHNFNTAIRNQGQCGSCMAFAYVGALEGLHLWRIGKPRGGVGTDFDLSEQELLDCAQDGEDWNGCEGGSSFRPFDAYLKTEGLALESCYPYEAQELECRRIGCVDKVKISGGSRITRWWPTSEEDLLALRRSIYERPVPTAMMIWADFQGYSGGVYDLTMTGDPEGGHALVIVGWDEDLRAWHVKNSWGRWGVDGFGWVRYGAAGIGSGAYRIEYMEDVSTREPEFCELPESIELDRSRPERFRLLRLQNCGKGQALDWTISADVDWLSFDAENGLAVIGLPHDVRIDPVLDSNPAAGATGEITVRAVMPGVIDPATAAYKEVAHTIAVTLTDSGGGSSSGGDSGGCAATGSVGGAGALLLVALGALFLRRRG